MSNCRVEIVEQLPGGFEGHTEQTAEETMQALTYPEGNLTNCQTGIMKDNTCIVEQSKHIEANAFTKKMSNYWKIILSINVYRCGVLDPNSGSMHTETGKVECRSKEITKDYMETMGIDQNNGLYGAEDSHIAHWINRYWAAVKQIIEVVYIQ